MLPTKIPGKYVRYYLLVCELATGIVLIQDCITRFQKHDSAMELPYIEIEVYSIEAARRLVTGILTTHPKVEVVIFDEQKKYVETISAYC
ncbi:hypothetical protein D0T11_19450 [Hymenobacter rubripertinctus]|uniref:Uncharacterized protein n=1 Tax=Hymenobacter rubripertinctus TaxID=2029981 RepID=A0A418QLQ0_9BACT|nr:hypothetical protein D0T11_19450 [Hymenobacter rubripertinctus]